MNQFQKTIAITYLSKSVIFRTINSNSSCALLYTPVGIDSVISTGKDGIQETAPAVTARDVQCSPVCSLILSKILIIYDLPHKSCFYSLQLNNACLCTKSLFQLIKLVSLEEFPGHLVTSIQYKYTSGKLILVTHDHGIWVKSFKINMCLKK